MPIYGYVCDRCSHEIEIMHGMSEPPPEECGECGGSLKRRFYPVATIFKGGGFYHTDYGKGKEFKKIEENEAKKETSSTDKTPDSGKPGTKSSGGTEPPKADPK